VQVGTANFIDPRTGVRLAEEIGHYLQRKQIAGVPEIVGAVQMK